MKIKEFILALIAAFLAIFSTLMRRDTQFLGIIALILWIITAILCVLSIIFCSITIKKKSKKILAVIGFLISLASLIYLIWYIFHPRVI